MRINGSIIGSNVTPSFLSGATGVWSMQNVELANRQIIWPTDIVTNGLVLFLDANNTNSYPGSGTSWYDLSGNSNSGTLINGPTFSSTNGGSIVFDGTNDYASFPTTLSTYPGTITGWFNSTNSGQILTITDTTDWHGWIISTSNTDINLNVVAGGGTDSSVSVSNSTTGFRFFSARLVSATSRFIDTVISGNITSTQNTVSRNPTGLDNLNLARNGGMWAAQYPNYLSGKISNILIYNRVLSVNEILQNYNARRDRFGV